MNFSAVSLRRIKNKIKQNPAKASRKKNNTQFNIHEGRSGRSARERTITAIANMVKISNTLSTRIVPRAEDIFIELLLED